MGHRRNMTAAARLTALASLALLTLVSIHPAGATSNDWPAFRGANADGAAREAEIFRGLDRFGLKLAWKSGLGSGYSSIAVADGIVVTLFSDGTNDVAAAFDEATGAEKWRFEIGPTYAGHDGSHTGPLSTPLIAGGRVFGLGARGRFFAVDAATGNEVWSTQLTQEYGVRKPHYGFATSPMLLDGVLILELGGENQAVAGFDPEDGKQLWKSGNDTVNYQSPVPFTLEGRRQVLGVGDKNLFGISAKTGEVLWEYAHGGSGPRGVWSLVPVPAGEGRVFLTYKDESSAMVTLKQEDEAVVATTLWEDRSIRNSYATPVYHDGHIYAFSSRFLTCVDAASGDVRWRSREPGDGFLIVVDGHLVITTKKGGVHVVKATPDSYQEVARLPIFDDLIWSSPGFANGRIYTRSLSEIARVDIQQGSADPVAMGTGEDFTGTRFSRFLAEVAAATDKKAVIDRFMKSQKQFPVVEGKDTVHFVYRGPGTDLAIGGDWIGARQERSMRHLEGTDLFYHSARLEPDTRSNYIFIRDYEELLDPLNSRSTTTLLFGKDMEMNFGPAAEPMEMSWFAMPEWTKPAHLQEANASRQGRIETRELESATLETSFSVDVYLPAGYDDSGSRYPVAYVYDGAAVRENGNLTNTLDNLIGERVEPVIVVFINLPAFPPWATAGKQAEVVARELVPYMDEHFRTLAVVEARASIGMGWAGFNAIVVSVGNPDVIGKMATQSAFVMDSMFGMLGPMLKSASEQPLGIYMDWGKYDLRNPDENWSMADSNRELARIFAEKGYTVAGGEVHDGTGWSSWTNRTDDALVALFPAQAAGGGR